MEMNLASMPDIKTIPQVNSAAVTSSDGNSQSCKPCESKFASIVNKEINGHENETGADNSAGITQGNELNSRSEQAGNTSDLNRSANSPQNESDKSGKGSVSGVHGKKGLKIDKQLLNLIGCSVTADTNGLQVNLINQIVDPEITDDELEQLNNQQGQNIPADISLPGSLIGQVVDTEVTEEKPGQSDDQQDQNMTAENGMTAALINQIVDTGTDETFEQLDDRQDHSLPAENGLKTGALLYALMNSAVNSTDDPNADAAQSNSDIMTNGAIVATEKKGQPERGLKAGIFLNELNNDNKTNNNVDKGMENLIDALAQDANNGISSEGSKAFSAEKLAERFDEINNNKQDHLKSADLKQDIKNIAIAEGNNNSENIQSKLSPELAGVSGKTGEFKNNPDTTAKTVKVESVPDNANFLTHSGAKPESGKPVEAIGNTVRPSGFTQMLDNIVYVIKGSSKLGVSVNHEILGKLNINLNMDKGILNVHINAAEKVTREFIENNIQHIVDSLAKDGVSVGGFSVGLRNRNGYEGQEGNVFKMNNEQGNRGIQVLDEKARISAIHGLVSVFA
jgi:hypothetical protein